MTSAPLPRPMPGSFWSRRAPTSAVARPMGRLTKNIQCQLMTCVMRPPASRPTEAPADATKLKMLIARARSPGSGNIVTTMPRMTAELTAPPTPCTNRAAISSGWLNDNPQSTEAAVNRISPIRKIRLRPIRSPSRPASSMIPA